MSAPTLINLPPPPSDPVTPSDMGPGTPNSGTTSLSALSTTAIKDGHQGHAFPHGHTHHSSSSSNSSTNTLDAERADRISRLAGLERVATVRQGGGPSHLAPGTSTATAQQPPGYFDNAQLQQKERSTVGSASATGSVGGRTTWASGSDVYDADKMSEDQDDGVSSSAGLSDEGNASLVGFGEGASSTISGPISSVGGRAPGGGRQSGLASPTIAKGNTTQGYTQQQGSTVGGGGVGGSPMQGIQSSTPSTMSPTAAEQQKRDAKMIDGMTYDPNIVDTTATTRRRVHERNMGMTGQETAERIVRERLEQGETGSGLGRRALGSPDEGNDGGKGLGKFYFEER
ncbi:MAG: hypothetical protein M1830_003724 [Pleopsidium flavum]|nr:MAG: hypothetical protein M1830_003743 [Pleopsidium flavum]KAI9870856.1 MAG: hypothetical protein M1830_003724 [Pleopsidium flavum]